MLLIKIKYTLYIKNYYILKLYINIYNHIIINSMNAQLYILDLEHNFYILNK